MENQTETNNTATNNSFFHNIKDFPPTDDGKINLVNYLGAADDLVSLVERLGNILAPVKYDMQGNIDKIKKYYVYDEATCLLELMVNEVNNGDFNGAVGVLWLNRATLFFELIFEEILKSLQSDKQDVDMTSVYTVAYEGSVKQYHNWITQQMFAVICKLSPSFPQILKYLEVDNDVDLFRTRLALFNTKLRKVRCKIDEYFKDHNSYYRKNKVL